MMTTHRIKQRGLKFYPQFRGWVTLWIWSSFDCLEIDYAPIFPPNVCVSYDEENRIYYLTIEQAALFIDESKKRKVNKSFNM